MFDSTRALYAFRPKGLRHSPARVADVFLCALLLAEFATSCQDLRRLAFQRIPFILRYSSTHTGEWLDVDLYVLRLRYVLLRQERLRPLRLHRPTQQHNVRYTVRRVLHLLHVAHDCDDYSVPLLHGSGLGRE